VPTERPVVNKPISKMPEQSVVFLKQRDYFTLMKPRVMSLAVFTAFCGLIVAPTSIPPMTLIFAMLAIALGAGGAGALNMWYDAEIDAVMSRTSGRPLPSGRIKPNEALGFGLIISVGSVVLLAITTNILAAGLLAFTIIFYAVIYTMWLKHSTPQNIVIGGTAGAIPPMIGWAAATGEITIQSVILFLIIFLWTPPHFWALALFKAGDYEAAGIPMMPVVAGKKSTRKQMFVYSTLLVPTAVLPSVFGPAGLLYGTVAVVLGLWFLRCAWAVLKSPPEGDTMQAEKRLFSFSILYLFLIFGALLVDVFIVPIPF